MTARETWALTRDMFLSEQEVETIRQSIRHRLQISEGPAWCSVKTDELIFEVLTFSGIRNSEFCHLRLCDVPPASKQSVLNITGTPRQDRSVAIPQTLAALIGDYVTSVRTQLLPGSPPRKNQDQPLALNDRGRPFDRTALYRRVVRILTTAGFESRASVQLLRHTYGYLAYKRTGGNLIFVQQQLGHAHPMVTAVYAEFVEFAANELADLVGINQTEQPSTLPLPSRKPVSRKK